MFDVVCALVNFGWEGAASERGCRVEGECHVICRYLRKRDLGSVARSWGTSWDETPSSELDMESEFRIEADIFTSFISHSTTWVGINFTTQSRLFTPHPARHTTTTRTQTPSSIANHIHAHFPADSCLAVGVHSAPQARLPHDTDSHPTQASPGRHRIGTRGHRILAASPDFALPAILPLPWRSSYRRRMTPATGRRVDLISNEIGL